MSDRKYRHNGYQDSGVESRGPKGPRPDMPPRPERVEGAPRGRSAGGFGPQAFKCARCGEKQHSWDDLDCASTCARCHLDLHTCTNCQHFDTSVHWQCRLADQLPDRVSPKDVRNLCALYTPRLVADLAADKSKAETPDDARKAFDALFKK